MAEEMDYYGTYEVNLALRERFRKGELRAAWSERFPFLFDEKDISQAINQPGYHFYEWLAAIIIYETTGFYSLRSHYQFKNHPKKQEVLFKLAHPEAIDLMTNSWKLYHVQCPDLLVYSPDLSEYFFCEVKGCTDRIRIEQLIFFKELQKVTGKRVCYLRFKPMKSSRWGASATARKLPIPTNGTEIDQ